MDDDSSMDIFTIIIICKGLINISRFTHRTNISELIANTVLVDAAGNKFLLFSCDFEANATCFVCYCMISIPYFTPQNVTCRERVKSL